LGGSLAGAPQQRLGVLQGFLASNFTLSNSYGWGFISWTICTSTVFRCKELFGGGAEVTVQREVRIKVRFGDPDPGALSRNLSFGSPH